MLKFKTFIHVNVLFIMFVLLFPEYNYSHYYKGFMTTPIAGNDIITTVIAPKQIYCIYMSFLSHLNVLFSNYYRFL